MSITPAMISAAIAGSLPRKKDNPAVPVKEPLAPSDAARVHRVAALCERDVRSVATQPETSHA